MESVLWGRPRQVCYNGMEKGHTLSEAGPTSRQDSAQSPGDQDVCYDSSPKAHVENILRDFQRIETFELDFCY